MSTQLTGTPRVFPSQTIWDGLGAGGDRLGEGGLIRRAIDPLELMQRVADQALAMISGAEGALVGLIIDGDHLRYVCGAGHLHDYVGERLALDGSLSGRAIHANSTLITDDTEQDPRVNRTATRSFNVRSSVCVPLGRGEQPVGIINVSSSCTGAFDGHDVALLSSLADFMSTVIGAASDFIAVSSRLLSAGREDAPAGDGLRADLAGHFVAGVLNPDGAEEMAVRERIERLLVGERYSLAFQPVFDIESGRPLGFEALARFGGEDAPPPDVWLAEAHRVGLGVDLEGALVEKAIACLDRLPGDALLAVNAGPEALVSARMADALARVDPARVVVELTEHVAVQDYPLLAEALSELRARGIRLAIDDAGAGFASLMHILKLAPDFIKLDRQLISGIDRDPVRQCLASSLMRFAEETGAEIVAEGVESASELGALRQLGIRRVQGFHLARPVALDELGPASMRGEQRIRDGLVATRL
ncbi:MAG TPA: EAL domain-containing protein [Solirubrobacteraceae bacterium]|jgi:EAL domain-containing protein (putative c-di-GMP-specific phosphodiesterase class I)